MKIMDKNDFNAFVNKLINAGIWDVLGVKSKGEKFVFDPLGSADELRLDYDVTLLSPKKYFHPQWETLMKFDLTDGVDVEKVNEVTPKMILGVHPYDIAALKQLDQVFGDENEDRNYLEKREESVIIGVNMVNVSPWAFAGDMGTATVEDGFDLMLTVLGDGYAVEIGTPKGRELLTRYANAAEAGADTEAEVARMKEALPPKFRKRLNFSPRELPKMLRKCLNAEVTLSKELSYPLSRLRPMLRENIRYQMFWEDHSKNCFSCGSCITTCPTCYCFDVVDIPDLTLEKGERARTWDGCMLQEFAKVASGENFRSRKGDRYQHRYLRKGLYLYERYGFIACVGCGRCGSACLPDIADPTKVLNDLKEVMG